MWPFSSDDDDENSCGGHHWGEERRRIQDSFVYKDLYWDDVDGDVFVLEVPLVKRCQHEGCLEEKEVGTKKLYVYEEDIFEDPDNLIAERGEVDHE